MSEGCGIGVMIGSLVVVGGLWGAAITASYYSKRIDESTPRTVVIRDFNGDGYQDAAIVTQENKYHIFLGNQDGALRSLDEI